MGDKPRKRFDLSDLPAAVRYPLALAVVAIVVVLVLAVTPSGAPVAGWYRVLVTVGAVVVLVLGVGWLLRRALGALSRSHRRPR
jgi:uncharacterized membrane protein YozB (DUF420 family)